jgi:hypothetical protein
MYVQAQDKYLFTGGKEGSYFLLRANALGGYNANNSNGNAYQYIRPKASTSGVGGIYSGAAYWPAGSSPPQGWCSAKIWATAVVLAA